MQKYVFNVLRNEKIFDIILNGFFQDEDARKFVAEYSTIVKSFEPKDYSLIIDCIKLSTIKADLIPDLEQCYKLYMSTGFRKIIFICPPNAIGRMQLERVGRNVDITADFVNSREEALNKAKI